MRAEYLPAVCRRNLEVLERYLLTVRPSAFNMIAHNTIYDPERKIKDDWDSDHVDNFVDSDLYDNGETLQDIRILRIRPKDKEIPGTMHSALGYCPFVPRAPFSQWWDKHHFYDTNALVRDAFPGINTDRTDTNDDAMFFVRGYNEGMWDWELDNILYDRRYFVFRLLFGDNWASRCNSPWEAASRCRFVARWSHSLWWMKKTILRECDDTMAWEGDAVQSYINGVTGITADMGAKDD